MAPAASQLRRLRRPGRRWHPDKLETPAGRDRRRAARLQRRAGRRPRRHGDLRHATGRAAPQQPHEPRFAAGRQHGHRRRVAVPARPARRRAALPRGPWDARIHDHWIALVALATGELAYVDRPLYDYVQHAEAVLGHEAIEARPHISRPQRLRRLARDPAGALDRWREAYEDEWCRTVAFARELRDRCGGRLDPRDRRALDLVLAGERSPRTWAWLAVRPLRSVAGHNETKGFEHRLLRGLLWRRLASRSAPIR